MLKRLHGKIRQSKSLVESTVIAGDVKLFAKDVSTKVITRNSITLDTTGKVVSIMFVSVLFHAMLTGLGNPRGRDG